MEILCLHRIGSAIRRIAVLFGFVAVLISMTTTASAHSFLVQTMPQANERLNSSPHQLVLQFTEKLVPAQNDSVTVKNASGQVVHIGALELAQGGTTLTANLPDLSSDVYIVDWHVISAEDGHPTMGEFAFGVGVQAVSSVSAVTQAPTEWKDAVSEWILLIGLAVSAGGLASEFFVWRSLTKDTKRFVRQAPVRIALWFAFIGAASLNIVFVLRLSGKLGLLTLADPHLWASALRQPAGALAFGSLLLVLLVMLLVPLRRVRSSMLILLVGASIATALRTHPASQNPWDAAVIAVHVTFAVMWVGALIHLAMVYTDKQQQISRDALLIGTQRYSRLAFWTVLLLIVTGTIAAFSQFTTARQLFDTTYGIVLLVKLGFVTVALFLATMARKQTVTASHPASLRPGRQLIRYEAGVLILILAISALLSNVSPPQTPTHTNKGASTLLGPPPAIGPTITMANRVGWMEVYLTASQGQLMIQVIGPKGDAPKGIHFTSDDTSGNAVYAKTPSGQDVGLALTSYGQGFFTAPLHWETGLTDVSIDVNSPDWSGGKATIAINWPPLPKDPTLFAKVIQTMQKQSSYLVKERVSSGPNSAFASTLHSSGAQFLEGEAYSVSVPDVQQLPSHDGYIQLVGYEPGSHIWFHMWVDHLYRIHREVIVASGHLVDNTYEYSSK